LDREHTSPDHREGETKLKSGQTIYRERSISTKQLARAPARHHDSSWFCPKLVETRIMLGKCSNPSCSAPFRYMRDGTLFRIEADPRVRRSKTGRLEYFWLCGSCSSKMSLRIGDEGNVLPVVLPAPNCADHGRGEITLIHRRDGLLLSRLGFSPGRGTGAVFFG
jgi:hypothetical protein